MMRVMETRRFWGVTSMSSAAANRKFHKPLTQWIVRKDLAIPKQQGMRQKHRTKGWLSFHVAQMPNPSAQSEIQLDIEVLFTSPIRGLSLWESSTVPERKIKRYRQVLRNQMTDTVQRDLSEEVYSISTPVDVSEIFLDILHNESKHHEGVELQQAVDIDFVDHIEQSYSFIENPLLKSFSYGDRIQLINGDAVIGEGIVIRVLPDGVLWADTSGYVRIQKISSHDSIRKL